MQHIFTLGTFLFFTGLVAWGTWLLTRKEKTDTNEGFFLAGRSLAFYFIAGSLLLTNLSTEQLVGLNGSAYNSGICVMVWEVLASVSLVAMALYFLPRFLKQGIATIPEFLSTRFGSKTATVVNIIFLLSYTFMLMPVILYTGATGLNGILDISTITGIKNPTVNLWIMIWFVGLVGMMYALFGGLRTVAVSDTLNGIGLLLGGFLIVVLVLRFIGEGQGIFHGIKVLYTTLPERFSPIGGRDSEVPFDQVFTGILLINVFYWTTNQQIIQRTFAACSLKEGQKGVLLCAFLKLLTPMFLVMPGMVAYYIFKTKMGMDIRSDEAYGMLVRKVLPLPLIGFFTAVVAGAILSSFNSVLNSTCTLYSLGVYKLYINKDATEEQVVKNSRWVGFVVAICSMLIAPMLANTGSIFNFLQNMNAVCFVPIFAVVLMGLISKRASDIGAVIALLGSTCVNILLTFVPVFKAYTKPWGYHVAALVFAAMLVFMYFFRPNKQFDETDKVNDAVDMTSWKYTWHCSIAIVLVVIGIYIFFVCL